MYSTETCSKHLHVFACFAGKKLKSLSCRLQAGKWSAPANQDLRPLLPMIPQRVSCATPERAQRAAQPEHFHQRYAPPATGLHRTLMASGWCCAGWRHIKPVVKFNTCWKLGLDAQVQSGDLKGTDKISKGISAACSGCAGQQEHAGHLPMSPHPVRP